MEDQVTLSEQDYKDLREKTRLKDTFFELLREPLFHDLIEEIYEHLQKRIPPKPGKKPFDPSKYRGMLAHHGFDSAEESRKLREEWTSI